MQIEYDLYFCEDNKLMMKRFPTLFEVNDFIGRKRLKYYLLQTSECDDDFSFPRHYNYRVLSEYYIENKQED